MAEEASIPGEGFIPNSGAANSSSEEDLLMSLALGDDESKGGSELAVEDEKHNSGEDEEGEEEAEEEEDGEFEEAKDDVMDDLVSMQASQADDDLSSLMSSKQGSAPQKAGYFHRLKRPTKPLKRAHFVAVGGRTALETVILKGAAEQTKMEQELSLNNGKKKKKSSFLGKSRDEGGVDLNIVVKYGMSLVLSRLCLPATRSGACMLEWGYFRGVDLSLKETLALARAHFELFVGRGLYAEKYHIIRAKNLYFEILEKCGMPVIPAQAVDVYGYPLDGYGVVRTHSKGGTAKKGLLGGMKMFGLKGKKADDDDDDDVAEANYTKKKAKSVEGWGLNVEKLLQVRHELCHVLRHLGELEALSLVTVCSDVLGYIISEGDKGIAEYYLMRASAYRDAGNYDEAANSLFEIINTAVMPGQLDRLEMMFLITMNLNQLENEKAKLEYRDYEPDYRMIFLQMEQDGAIEKEVEYDDWLADYNTWNNLAEKCMNLRQYNLAADLIGQALIRDRSGEYRRHINWWRLGKAFYACGRVGEARSALAQALAIDMERGQYLSVARCWWIEANDFERSCHMGKMGDIIATIPPQEGMFGLEEPAHAKLRSLLKIARVRHKEQLAREAELEKIRLKNEAKEALLAAGLKEMGMEGRQPIKKDRNKQNPKIAWKTPNNIIYPSKLTPNECNAVCKDIEGDLEYFPGTDSKPLPAGEHSIDVVFTPKNTKKFNQAELSVTLVVDKASPLVKWKQPPTLYDGSLMEPDSHLNAKLVNHLTELDASDPQHPNNKKSKSTNGSFGAERGNAEQLVDPPAGVFRYYLDPQSNDEDMRLPQEDDSHVRLFNDEYYLNVEKDKAGTNELDMIPWEEITDETALPIGYHRVLCFFRPNDLVNYVRVRKFQYIKVVPRIIPTMTWPKPDTIVYRTPLSKMELSAKAKGIEGDPVAVEGMTKRDKKDSGDHKVSLRGKYKYYYCLSEEDLASPEYVKEQERLEIQREEEMFEQQELEGMMVEDEWLAAELDRQAALHGAEEAAKAAEEERLKTMSEEEEESPKKKDGKKSSGRRKKKNPLKRKKIKKKKVENVDEDLEGSLDSSLELSNDNGTPPTAERDLSNRGGWMRRPDLFHEKGEEKLVLLSKSDYYQHILDLPKMRIKNGFVPPTGKCRLLCVFIPDDRIKFDMGVSFLKLEIVRAQPDVKWSAKLPPCYSTELLHRMKHLTATLTTDLDAQSYTGFNALPPEPVTKPVPKGKFVYTITTVAILSALAETDIEEASVVTKEGSEIVNLQTQQKSTRKLIIELEADDAREEEKCDYAHPFGSLGGDIGFLPKGHHVIEVEYFPSDMRNHEHAYASSNFTVRCRPEILWDPVFQGQLRHGLPVGADQLCAYVDECPGELQYTPPMGEILEIGHYQVKAKFSPADPTIHDITYGVRTLVVVRKISPLVAWEIPPIAYGVPVDEDNICTARIISSKHSRFADLTSTSNGTLTDTNSKSTLNSNDPEAPGFQVVDGTFSYNIELGAVLDSGSYSVTATFTPEDTITYAAVTVVNQLVVTPLQTTISFQPDDPLLSMMLTYGEPLADPQFCAAVTFPKEEDIPHMFGMMSYSHVEGDYLATGQHEITATYEPLPPYDKNYLPCTITGTVTIEKYAPLLAWTAPNPVVFGSGCLSRKQLGADLMDQFIPQYEEGRRLQSEPRKDNNVARMVTYDQPVSGSHDEEYDVGGGNVVNNHHNHQNQPNQPNQHHLITGGDMYYYGEQQANIGVGEEYSQEDSQDYSESQEDQYGSPSMIRQPSVYTTGEQTFNFITSQSIGPNDPASLEGGSQEELDGYKSNMNSIDGFGELSVASAADTQATGGNNNSNVHPSPFTAGGGSLVSFAPTIPSSASGIIPSQSHSKEELDAMSQEDRENAMRYGNTSYNNQYDTTGMGNQVGFDLSQVSLGIYTDHGETMACDSLDESQTPGGPMTLGATTIATYGTSAANTANDSGGIDSSVRILDTGMEAGLADQLGPPKLPGNWSAADLDMIAQGSLGDSLTFEGDSQKGWSVEGGHTMDPGSLQTWQQSMELQEGGMIKLGFGSPANIGELSVGMFSPMGGMGGQVGVMSAFGSSIGGQSELQAPSAEGSSVPRLDLRQEEPVDPAAGLAPFDVGLEEYVQSTAKALREFSRQHPASERREGFDYDDGINSTDGQSFGVGEAIGTRGGVRVGPPLHYEEIEQQRHAEERRSNGRGSNNNGYNGSPGAIDLGDERAKMPVRGVIRYSPDVGTVFPHAGVFTLRAIFEPDDKVNIAVVEVAVEVTVLKARPVVRWEQPEPLFAGTPLSLAQLCPTVHCPGIRYAGNVDDMQETEEMVRAREAGVVLSENEKNIIRSSKQLDGQLEFYPRRGEVLECGLHVLRCRFVPFAASAHNFDCDNSWAEVPLLVKPKPFDKSGVDDIRSGKKNKKTWVTGMAWPVREVKELPPPNGPSSKKGMAKAKSASRPQTVANTSSFTRDQQIARLTDSSIVSNEQSYRRSDEFEVSPRTGSDLQALTQNIHAARDARELLAAHSRDARSLGSQRPLTALELPTGRHLMNTPYAEPQGQPPIRRTTSSAGSFIDYDPGFDKPEVEPQNRDGVPVQLDAFGRIMYTEDSEKTQTQWQDAFSGRPVDPAEAYAGRTYGEMGKFQNFAGGIPIDQAAAAAAGRSRSQSASNIKKSQGQGQGEYREGFNSHNDSLGSYFDDADDGSYGGSNNKYLLQNLELSNYEVGTDTEPHNSHLLCIPNNAQSSAATEQARAATSGGETHFSATTATLPGLRKRGMSPARASTAGAQKIFRQGKGKDKGKTTDSAASPIKRPLFHTGTGNSGKNTTQTVDDLMAKSGKTNKNSSTRPFNWNFFVDVRNVFDDSANNNVKGTKTGAGASLLQDRDAKINREDLYTSLDASPASLPRAQTAGAMTTTTTMANPGIDKEIDEFKAREQLVKLERQINSLRRDAYGIAKMVSYVEKVRSKTVANGGAHPKSPKSKRRQPLDDDYSAASAAEEYEESIIEKQRAAPVGLARIPGIGTGAASRIVSSYELSHPYQDIDLRQLEEQSGPQALMKNMGQWDQDTKHNYARATATSDRLTDFADKTKTTKKKGIKGPKKVSAKTRKKTEKEKSGKWKALDSVNQGPGPEMVTLASATLAAPPRAPTGRESTPATGDRPHAVAGNAVNAVRGRPNSVL